MMNASSLLLAHAHISCIFLDCHSFTAVFSSHTIQVMLFLTAVWWMLCLRDSLWLITVVWAPRHFLMSWYGTWLISFYRSHLLYNWASNNTEYIIVFQDLGAIANPMFKLKGPSMLQGSYNPAFPLKHQQKDMKLALALGDENAVSMPVAAASNEVRRLSSPFSPQPVKAENTATDCLNSSLWFAESQAFKKARSLGLGDLDFSAVYEVLKGAGGSGKAWNSER